MYAEYSFYLVQSPGGQYAFCTVPRFFCRLEQDSNLTRQFMLTLLQQDCGTQDDSAMEVMTTGVHLSGNL
ncbi:hypothetical protein D3C75_1349970 [compost metagenome]